MEIDEDLNVSSLPLPKYEHWDEAVRAFLKDAGLIQALRGFECDMVMMNSQWERAQVPTALENLIEGLGVSFFHLNSDNVKFMTFEEYL